MTLLLLLLVVLLFFYLTGFWLKVFETWIRGEGRQLLRPSAPSLLVIPFFPSCRLNNEQFCRAVEITFSRGHLSALINIFRRKWSETSRLPKTETNWRFYAMSNQSFLYMFEFKWLDRTGWGDVSFKVVRWNNDWTFFHIRHLLFILYQAHTPIICIVIYWNVNCLTVQMIGFIKSRM